jgi:hypothetical protein
MNTRTRVKAAGSEDKAARPASAWAESRAGRNEYSTLQIAFDMIARDLNEPQTEPAGGDKAFRRVHCHQSR